MKASERPGRQCRAVLSDGTRCRQRALNGLAEPLCHVHARVKKGTTKCSPRHGFYSQDSNLEHFEYLRRVRPEDWVQGGGLTPAKEGALQIQEREMDLHPSDPKEAGTDVAIAALLHKMEILDALIFRAEEHGLDIIVLLSLYLQSTSKLGRLVLERHEVAANEHDDLLALLERANEQLDGTA